MDDEQSLLEQVRQKEGELKKKLQDIHDLNAKKIDAARKKADENIAKAEHESDEEIERYFVDRRLELKKEMDDLVNLNNARKTEIIMLGEGNLEKAIFRIVNLVSMKEDYAAEND